MKKDQPAVNLPDLTAGNEQLLHGLLSDSSVLRQAAQREFVRRAKDMPTASDIGSLLSVVENQENLHPTIAQRVATLYTAAQIKHKISPAGPAAPLDLLQKPDLVEFVLRALADYADKPEEVPSDIFIPWLTDKNPRNREAAVIALRRLHKADAAQAFCPSSPMKIPSSRISLFAPCAN
ncbi:MAG: hypothetical protein WDN28_11350 [Chthoniobacter sp.]